MLFQKRYLKGENMKAKSKIIGVITLLLIAGLYYYLARPAINIHSTDVCVFVLFLVAAVGIIYAFKKRIGRNHIKETYYLHFVGSSLAFH